MWRECSLPVKVFEDLVLASLAGGDPSDEATSTATMNQHLKRNQSTDAMVSCFRLVFGMADTREYASHGYQPPSSDFGSSSSNPLMGEFTGKFLFKMMSMNSKYSARR